MKLNRSAPADGFAFLIPLLLIVVVAVIVCGGYLILKFESSQANKPAASPSQIASGASASGGTSLSLHAFYDCVDSLTPHVVTHTRPVTCTINGDKIELPSAFDTSQIDELDSAPASVRPLITSQARQRFSSCSQFSAYHNLPGIPQADVSLAQSNFVAVYFDCYYSGTEHAYGLSGGTWTDLGEFQYLACGWVDAYHIHQSAVLPFENLGSASSVLCQSDDNSFHFLPA